MSKPIQRIRIDVTKVNKEAIFVGKKGKYVDLAVWDSPKDFGERKTDGFVTQELPKAMREAGQKGEILGNWEYTEARKSPAPTPPKNNQGADVADDDIPF
mgnify:CR=1 FL=1